MEKINSKLQNLYSFANKNLVETYNLINFAKFILSISKLAMMIDFYSFLFLFSLVYTLEKINYYLTFYIVLRII